MFHKKRRIACILYLVLLIAVIVLAFIVSHFDLQPHHTWTERDAACFVCAPGDGRLSSLPCRNAYIGHGCRFEATYIRSTPSFFSRPEGEILSFPLVIVFIAIGETSRVSKRYYIVLGSSS